MSNPQVSFTQTAIADKNMEVIRPFFDTVLFNSGKVPNESEMEIYLAELFLQTNYSQTVWAAHQFDLSGGKSDTAKLIQGPVLIIHGTLDLLVAQLYAMVWNQS